MGARIHYRINAHHAAGKAFSREGIGCDDSLVTLGDSGVIGLGNGYDTSKSGDSPVLIGGGVGVPPMYMLCKKLISEGKNVSVILGFNSEKEIFGVEEFEATGAKVYVATVDGSVGTKGFVTDVLKNIDYSYYAGQYSTSEL